MFMSSLSHMADNSPRVIRTDCLVQHVGVPHREVVRHLLAVQLRRFHGPLLNQKSWVGVTSLGGPYCSTSYWASCFGVSDH
jgi:hypothetical protein